ncbi:MAG: ATP:cob(I)alamin adenosyltransferase [Thermoproteus sp.]|nr:ATP:cob(I)alamin adenosyltransferase [Thermoproteus sp.]
MIVKPCVLAGRCPGDLGETDAMWFGRIERASKASAVIKLFGALESAMAYVNLTAIKATDKRARILRLIQWILQYTGFYLSTGDARYLDVAFSLLRKAAKLTYAISSDAPPGWVICEDEECALINTARTWVRWAERRLAQTEEGKEAIVLLNHISSILFELMRTRPHLIINGTVSRYR